jgi:type II secretory pathway predicted ATPase ExeA
MSSEPQKARYLPQVVYDYKGNPLIEALPPIYSTYDAAKLLTVDPGYHEGERELDEQYRTHCISRLFRYFQPLDVHLDIEQRVSRAIRQSYISKNPASPQYAAGLADGAAAIRQSNVSAAKNVHSTATGFTVIGMSGVGKTTAIERILSLYPQTILHTRYNDAPLFLTQLVWAKLDCPFDGSLKGLCLSFFDYVDQILGTDYGKRFSVYRMTVDSALPRMAQIARAHSLGLLVIDEIQHLNQAKSGGQAKMLNFFVTLVNTVGVPVVLIGTTKAMSVLQSEFRQARRGSGQGDLIWERMQNDISWEIMLRAMWKNQWTRKKTLFTDELKNVLYDESQGIIDIAVKLYALAQIKAIADGTEEISVKTIREVAAEKLTLVRSALDALRSGDVRKMAQFGDITPITVDDYFAAQSSRIPDDPAWSKNDALSLEEQTVLKLLEMDVPSKVARSAVRKAIGKAATGQPLSGVIRKAFKIALNMEDEKDASDRTPLAGDLRDVPDGNFYDALKNSGSIVESADEF